MPSTTPRNKRKHIEENYEKYITNEYSNTSSIASTILGNSDSILGEPLIFKPKQDENDPQGTWRDVVSHAWVKTFPSDSDNLNLDEFNGELVETIALRLRQEHYSGLELTDKATEEEIANVRAAIQQHREAVKPYALWGLPTTFALDEEVTFFEVMKKFVGWQSRNRNPWRSLLNIILFVTGITPVWSIGRMLLTSLRTLIKIPTQFAATTFADLFDFWSELTTSKLGKGLLLLGSSIAWAFQLIYTSAFSPVQGVLNGWDAGHEYAGPNHPWLGHFYGTVLAGTSAALTIAIWAGTGFLAAKYFGADLALKIGDALTTTPYVSWVAAKLAPVVSNVIVPILNWLNLSSLASTPIATLLAGLGVGAVAFPTVGTVLSRVYEKFDAWWNVFKKPMKPYELVNDDTHVSDIHVSEYESDARLSTRTIQAITQAPDKTVTAEVQDDKVKVINVDFANKSKQHSNQFIQAHKLNPQGKPEEKVTQTASFKK